MTILQLSKDDDYSSYNFLEGFCKQGDLIKTYKKTLACEHGQLEPIRIEVNTVMMYLGSRLSRTTYSSCPYGMYAYFILDEKVVYDGFDLKDPKDFEERLKTMKKIFARCYKNISEG